MNARETLLFCAYNHFTIPHDFVGAILFGDALAGQVEQIKALWDVNMFVPSLYTFIADADWYLAAIKSMGYPDIASEMEIAKGKSRGVSYENLEAVIDSDELCVMKSIVEGIFIHDNIYEYIARLIQATRDNPYIELGVSPRGTIACARMCRASVVLPEDSGP